MVNENNNINLIVKENYKQVEEVREINNEIPSYEEFMKTYMKTYENDGNVNYDDLSGSDIGEVKSYGPGNSNSTDKDKAARTGSKLFLGTALTIGTIVCPPAGLGAAASVAAVTGTAKAVSNIAADKDSGCKEVCDEVDSLVWDSIETSAKQLMIIKGGKEILK